MSEQNESDEVKQARADLRKDFLAALSNLEGKTVTSLGMFNAASTKSANPSTSSENKTEVKFLASDREQLHFVLSNFKTPTGDILDSAIIRATDIDHLSFDAKNFE